MRFDCLLCMEESTANNMIAVITIIERLNISHISMSGSKISLERLTLIKIWTGMANRKAMAAASNFRDLIFLNMMKTTHKNTIEMTDILTPMGKNRSPALRI